MTVGRYSKKGPGKGKAGRGGEPSGATKVTLAGRVAAVVVNHDDGPLALEQLSAHAAFDPERFGAIDWRLVHNGEGPPPSSGGACGKLAGVRVHVRPNRGYGAAVNFALQETVAPFLLVLNADLTPAPGFLQGLEAIVDGMASASPRIGVAGFRLLNPDGTRQGSAGPFPNLARVAAGLLRPRATRKYLDLPGDRAVDVPWVTGAALVASRECLTELGGFDERYFMYYEDVDLCRRAWKAGYRVVFDPRAALVHHNPYHGRRLTHRLVYLARHGLLTYFHCHRPRWEEWTLGRIMRTEAAIRRFRADPRDRDGWGRIAGMIRRYSRDPDRPLDPAELPSS